MLKVCQTMMIKYDAIRFGLSVSRFLHSLSAVTSLQRPIMCWKLSNEQLHSIPKVSWHANLKPTLCHVWTKYYNTNIDDGFASWQQQCLALGRHYFHLVLVMNIRLLKERCHKRRSRYRKIKQAEKNEQDKGKHFIVLVPKGLGHTLAE